MPQTLITAYPLAAVTEDQVSGTFRLDPDFSADRDGLRIAVGVAARRRPEAAAMMADGAPLAAGPYTEASVAELAMREGRAIILDRITVGDAFAAYVASEPLEPGFAYPSRRAVPAGAGGMTLLAMAEDGQARAFGPGAMIAAEDGELPVEWLRQGGRVPRRDSGYRSMPWVARLIPAPLFGIVAGAPGPGSTGRSCPPRR